MSDKYALYKNFDDIFDSRFEGPPPPKIKEEENANPIVDNERKKNTKKILDFFEKLNNEVTQKKTVSSAIADKTGDVVMSPVEDSGVEIKPEDQFPNPFKNARMIRPVSDQEPVNPFFKNDTIPYIPHIPYMIKNDTFPRPVMVSQDKKQMIIENDIEPDYEAPPGSMPITKNEIDKELKVSTIETIPVSKQQAISKMLDLRREDFIDELGAKSKQKEDSIEKPPLMLETILDESTEISNNEVMDELDYYLKKNKDIDFINLISNYKLNYISKQLEKNNRNVISYADFSTKQKKHQEEIQKLENDLKAYNDLKTKYENQLNDLNERYVKAIDEKNKTEEARQNSLALLKDYIDGGNVLEKNINENERKLMEMNELLSEKDALNKKNFDKMKDLIAENEYLKKRQDISDFESFLKSAQMKNLERKKHENGFSWKPGAARTENMDTKEDLAKDILIEDLKKKYNDKDRELFYEKYIFKPKNDNTRLQNAITWYTHKINELEDSLDKMKRKAHVNEERLEQYRKQRKQFGNILDFLFSDVSKLLSERGVGPTDRQSIKAMINTYLKFVENFHVPEIGPLLVLASMSIDEYTNKSEIAAKISNAIVSYASHIPARNFSEIKNAQEFYLNLVKVTSPKLYNELRNEPDFFYRHLFNSPEDTKFPKMNNSFEFPFVIKLLMENTLPKTKEESDSFVKMYTGMFETKNTNIKGALLKAASLLTHPSFLSLASKAILNYNIPPEISNAIITFLARGIVKQINNL